MLLAIPILNGRVSPVFDTACRLLLIEVEQGSEQARRTVELADSLPMRRVERLRALGVEVLVCGGISRPLGTMCEAAGMRVVPWIAGPVDEIVQAYLAKNLPHPRWMMPGCLCQPHHHRGRSWGQGRRVRGQHPTKEDV